MNWLTFLSSVIDSLAWPATTFVVVYLLRDAIGDLARSIREGKLKYKDLELEISRDLGEARKALDSVPSVPQVTARKEDEDDRLLLLPEVSPRAAILEAWTRVEMAGVNAAIRVLGLPEKEAKRLPIRFVEVLRNRMIIDAEVAGAIQRLRDIRNRTAHLVEFQPSTSDAEEYVLLALGVVEDLKRGKKA